MVGVVDVCVQAANPTMPLYPLRAYLNSPSSLRVRNVPKKVGEWRITSVQIAVAYPDSTIKTAECKLIGSVWVGTVAGSSASGTSENGYTVYASGIDENGDEVHDYVLGKGLVEILTTDGTITPSVDTTYVHLFSEQPANPKEGDMWQNANGDFVVWQDGEAIPLGMTEAEVLEMIDGRLAGFVRRQEFNDALDTKQDTLSADQIAAIDQKLYEMQTHIVFSDNTHKDALIVGDFNHGDLDDKQPVSVKLGNSVTSIGGGAFVQCINLTSMTIPNSVTSIDADAFALCDGLTSMTIPDNVTSIGNHAFEGCSNLTSVTFIGKTLAQVQAMADYPWDINQSIITTWNDASQEWVSVQLGDIETILNNL